MVAKDEIERMFTYHASPERVPHFQALTEGTKELAHIFNEHVPDGPDKDQALNFLRLARMMGNAAIACEGR